MLAICKSYMISPGSEVLWDVKDDLVEGDRPLNYEALLIN